MSALIPGSKRFDALIVFVKEFFEKVNFEHFQYDNKNMKKLPNMQRVTMSLFTYCLIDRASEQGEYAGGLLLEENCSHVLYCILQAFM